jgi:hypothetical protein
MAADSVTAVEADVELHPRIKAERERGLVESADDCKKKRFDLMVERKMAHLLPPRLERENTEAVKPTTVFHQHKEIDYQGQLWILLPPGVKGVDLLDTKRSCLFCAQKVFFSFHWSHQGCALHSTVPSNRTFVVERRIGWIVQGVVRSTRTSHENIQRTHCCRQRCSIQQ